MDAVTEARRLLRVSVGMPARNAAATIGRAIEAVQRQTLGDFELIVSDNASTDGTGEVYRARAAADPRIVAVRHPAPISAFDNFACVLQRARASYFVWAAADDLMLPTFLERAVAVLDARPQVVCCVPRVEFRDASGCSSPATGTFALLGSRRDNVARFLAQPGDNSRFYGLWRSEALRRSMTARGFYATDWAIVLASLRLGLHWEIPEVLIVRQPSERLKYVRALDVSGEPARRRLFPLLPFTRHVLLGRLLPLSPSSLFALVALNVSHHVEYARYAYPRYGEAAFRVGRAAARVLGVAAPGGEGS